MREWINEKFNKKISDNLRNLQETKYKHMKIISYNVNGIRAAIKKGLIDWIKVVDPEISFIHLTKAQSHLIPIFDMEEALYMGYWFKAQKKGYSRVGILTKKKADKIV